MAPEKTSQITCVFDDNNKFYAGRRLHDDHAFTRLFYEMVPGATIDVKGPQVIVIRANKTKDDLCKLLGWKTLGRILLHDELQKPDSIIFS